jgi:hypothetical protein
MGTKVLCVPVRARLDGESGSTAKGLAKHPFPSFARTVAGGGRAGEGSLAQQLHKQVVDDISFTQQITSKDPSMAETISKYARDYGK